MAGTQRFQKAAFRANPCIISTGVEPSHGHRKSSTMQWTEAPSGRAMRGIGSSFGFQLRISKPIIELGYSALWLPDSCVGPVLEMIREHQLRREPQHRSQRIIELSL